MVATECAQEAIGFVQYPSPVDEMFVVWLAGGLSLSEVTRPLPRGDLLLNDYGNYKHSAPPERA